MAAQTLQMGPVHVGSVDAAVVPPATRFGESGARQWGSYPIMVDDGTGTNTLVPVLGGENTLGVSWYGPDQTGRQGNGKDALYQAFATTLCLSWNDNVLVGLTPPMTATDCSPPITSTIGNVDPILFTDFDGGRTIAGGLEITPDITKLPPPAAAANPYTTLVCNTLPTVTYNPPPFGLGIWPQGCMEGCSVLQYTDTTDGSDGWFPAGNACSLPGWDHETVVYGPWSYPQPSWASYNRAAYYCSQGGFPYSGTAGCWVSGDGGLTWEPVSNINYGGKVGPPGGVDASGTQCTGLHGHLRVTRAFNVSDTATNDGPHPGDVYLPFKDCSGKSSFVWSSDNGISWNVVSSPQFGAGYPNQADCSSFTPVGLSPSPFDPSLAPSLEHGWVYFGQTEFSSPAGINDGAYVAMTKTNGVTWEDMGVGNGACPGTKYLNVGALANPPVLQSAFAEMMVGDDDRAAFAFLGTTDSSSETFANSCGIGDTWYLYVALTYDAGRTWTVDRVSNDPVQKGGIWAFGGGSPCRNMLDFNDIVTDQYGRILVSFTDGCTGTCAGLTTTPDACGAGTRSCTASVARQVTGRGLMSKYDIPDPQPAPLQPTESGENDAGPNTLGPAPEGATDHADTDGDGVFDPRDNCLNVGNPDQKDTDLDGVGNACDADMDGDGFPNLTDDCEGVANVDQRDGDGDGMGDVCDTDADNDGILNASDNCWVVKNADQANLDKDTDGDACDLDLDGDGMPNGKDCKPNDPTRWSCAEQQAANEAAAAELGKQANRAQGRLAGTANSTAVLMIGGAVVLVGLVALTLLMMRRKP